VLYQPKLDRSFVRDMTENRNDAAIVQSTIQLDRTLGLEVVAEGAETEQALEQLAAFRCHPAQGVLIGRPVLADQLESWLAERGAAGRLIARSAVWLPHGRRAPAAAGAPRDPQ
jgi:EAL domain-containing protein (putative c-di-GMP-specific phosphodiesterase class I)